MLAVAKATIQNVRVTNWPTPAPTHSPFSFPLAIPGVDVGWATFWLTAAAFLVAIAAVRYAYRAFKAAEEDLGISKRNLAVAQRTPQLEASFVCSNQSQQRVDIGGGVICRQELTSQLTAFVTNGATGERRCDAFFIEIFVQRDALAFPDLAQMSCQGGPVGEEVRYEEVVADQVLFPSGTAAPVQWHVPLRYVLEPSETEIKYRLKDDYREYPEKGYSIARVPLPMRRADMPIAPRDDVEQRMWTEISARCPKDVAASAYAKAFAILEERGSLCLADRTIAAREITKECCA
jgi:hypothetical protein